MVADEDNQSTLGVFSTGIPANNHLQFLTLQPAIKYHEKITNMQWAKQLSLLPPPITETKHPGVITINNLFSSQSFAPVILALHPVGQGYE
jgi:hypothetical protein